MSEYIPDENDLDWLNNGLSEPVLYPAKGQMEWRHEQTLRKKREKAENKKVTVQVEMGEDAWRVIKVILIVIAIAAGLYLLNKLPADQPGDNPYSATCEQYGNC